MLTVKQIRQLTSPYTNKQIAKEGVRVGKGVWANKAGNILFYEDLPKVLADNWLYQDAPVLTAEKIKKLEASITQQVWPIEIRGETDEHSGKPCYAQVQLTDGHEDVWVNGYYLACLIKRGAVDFWYGNQLIAGRSAEGRSVGLLAILFGDFLSKTESDWRLCNTELPD